MIASLMALSVRMRWVVLLFFLHGVRLPRENLVAALLHWRLRVCQPTPPDRWPPQLTALVRPLRKALPPVALFAFGWALMVPVVTLLVLDLVPERLALAAAHGVEVIDQIGRAHV